jgi:quercetin dioxygenase-like cupin family protein
MRNLRFAAACSALLCAASAVQAQDPVVVGPNLYKQLMDNPRVRVLEVTFAPGAEMPTHSHPDHLGYVTEAGTLTITGADGKAQVHEFKVGDTVWLPATSHSAKNTGSTQVRVLVVELKEPAPK